MITITDLNENTFKAITQELETEKWFETLWYGQAPGTVSIQLAEYVILKSYHDEIMLDFNGWKTFFNKEDFFEIIIE